SVQKSGSAKNDVCRRLCDGGEPRQLWLDEEVSGDGWIRMMAAAETGQRCIINVYVTLKTDGVRFELSTMSGSLRYLEKLTLSLCDHKHSVEEETGSWAFSNAISMRTKKVKPGYM
ncbi:hypothetical protein Tco_0164851, partial [Tanacetum coccineum]